MNNLDNLLEILRSNECMSMKVDMYDTKTKGISSWFMNEYRIRSDDKKIVIYGKDEDVSCHWIKLAANSVMTNLQQDNVFDVIVLRFTYNDRYFIEIKINTLRKENRSLTKDSYLHYKKNI